VERVQLAADASSLSTTIAELIEIRRRRPRRRRLGTRPSAMPATAPATVISSTWAIAPGTRDDRTGDSRRSENSTPSANSSRTTPTSASSPIPASPTNPGVNGPMTTLATR
jgi:hypothetical protein